MRSRLEIRLTAADVDQRVVIRRLRPGPDDVEQMTDGLGILEECDAQSFAVRTRDGQLVVIPSTRALAGKVVPPAPPPRRRRKVPNLLNDAAARRVTAQLQYRYQRPDDLAGGYG